MLTRLTNMLIVFLFTPTVSTFQASPFVFVKRGKSKIAVLQSESALQRFYTERSEDHFIFD